MMWLVLFVALILLVIFMENKEDVKITEEADMITIDIRNLTCGEITITLDY